MSGEPKDSNVDLASPGVAADSRMRRQLWVDILRVAALLMIFLFHSTQDWVESIGASPSTTEQFIANHFAGWGIAAFVVLSGFSLALTRLTPSTSNAVYFSRRLTRIFSPYWTIALPFALAGFLLHEAAVSDAWKLPIWLLGLGPISQATYQPISEAWWYISLALQISLVMPALIRVRRALGLLPLAVLALGVNAAALACVQAAPGQWAYLAQGLVLCRLTELMIGFAAAEIMLSRGIDRRRLLMATASIALVMAASPALSMLRLWTGWPATLVLGVVFAGCAFIPSRLSPRWRPIVWAASLSYVFYLTHAPVSKYFGRLLVALGLENTFVALPIILLVCTVVAWVADWFVRRFVTPYVSRFFDWLLIRDETSRLRPGG